MSFAKLNTALSGGSIQGVDVAFAWDGDFDCDLVFGLGANNQLQDAVYFDRPFSQQAPGTTVHKDKKNGYGFGKSDESGSINLAALPQHITEVAVGGMVQKGFTLDRVPNAEIFIFQGGTRAELAKLDMDASFAGCQGGKVGEFQRTPNGLWTWVSQPRGFRTLDEMEWALMQ